MWTKFARMHAQRHAPRCREVESVSDMKACAEHFGECVGSWTGYGLEEQDERFGQLPRHQLAGRPGTANRHQDTQSVDRIDAMPG